MSIVSRYLHIALSEDGRNTGRMSADANDARRDEGAPDPAAGPRLHGDMLVSALLAFLKSSQASRAAEYAYTGEQILDHQPAAL